MCSPSEKKDQPPSRERRVCTFGAVTTSSPSYRCVSLTFSAACSVDVAFFDHSARRRYYASCSSFRQLHKKILTSTTAPRSPRELLWSATAAAQGKRTMTYPERNGRAAHRVRFLQRIAGTLCRDRHDLGTVSPDEPGCPVENVQDRGRLGRRQQCPGSLTVLHPKAGLPGATRDLPAGSTSGSKRRSRARAEPRRLLPQATICRRATRWPAGCP